MELFSTLELSNRLKKVKKSKLIGIKSNLKFTSKDIGSSICCNGVCLTLTKIQKRINFFLYFK